MNKKFLVLILVLLACTSGAFAQKTAYVNTETIFKSIPQYTKALKTIDDMAAQYQKVIDQEFAAIEQLYNDYQRVKGQMSQTARERREMEIMDREKVITEYQKNVFGPEGDIMKKRMELIKPIQDRVFQVIKQVAQTKYYDAVIDVANNPSILYYSPKLDISKEVLFLLGNKN